MEKGGIRQQPQAIPRRHQMFFRFFVGSQRIALKHDGIDGMFLKQPFCHVGIDDRPWYRFSADITQHGQRIVV